MPTITVLQSTTGITQSEADALYLGKTEESITPQPSKSHSIDGSEHTGEGDLVTKDETALSIIADQINDATSVGKFVLTAPTEADARMAISCALQTYNMNGDPTADYDEDDNAGVGIEFRVGDVVINTTAHKWYRADSVGAHAAIWERFDPGKYGTAATKDTGTSIGNIPQLISLGGGIAGYPGVRGDLITVDGATTLATIKGTAEDAVQPPADIYRPEWSIQRHDGSNWIAGINDPLTGLALDAIWTENYTEGGGHPNQSVTPSAAGVVLVDNAAVGDMGVSISATIPQACRLMGRLHVTLDTIADWTQVDLAIKSGTKFILSGFGWNTGDDYYAQIQENGDYTSDTTPAASAAWIGFYYDPATRLLKAFYDVTTLASADPGDVFSGTNWVEIATTKTVAIADRNVAPWNVVIDLIKGHSSPAQATIRAPATGLITLL